MYNNLCVILLLSLYENEYGSNISIAHSIVN